MDGCRGLQASLEQAEEASGICLMPRVRHMQAQLEAKDRQLQSVQVFFLTRCQDMLLLHACYVTHGMTGML